MDNEIILERISRGRTDDVFKLLRKNNWKEIIKQGNIKPLELTGISWGTICPKKTK